MTQLLTATIRTLSRSVALQTTVLITVALALYCATLAPGLLWGGGDFARFQTWAYLGRIDGPVDVLAHPLWVILAHPFTWLPIHTPAWRANFASAVFCTAALAFTFLSARSLSRTSQSALLATIALALSHTFWTYAVMPKVYSLNALMLAACIYLLLRWRTEGNTIYLCLFAFIYGLSMLNHLVMATAAVGFAAFIGIVLWPRRRTVGVWATLLLAALFFALGMLPYLYLTFQGGTAQATGGTVSNFLKGLLYAFVHPKALLMGIGWGIALGVYQFPVTSLVGLLGLYQLWRRDIATAALISLIILGTVAFLLGALDPTAGSVYVWNLHYYLQAYAAFALALAPGFDRLEEIWRFDKRVLAIGAVALTIAAPVLLYATAPIIVRPFLSNVPDFRPLPGRDNLRYRQISQRLYNK